MAELNTISRCCCQTADHTKPQSAKTTAQTLVITNPQTTLSEQVATMVLPDMTLKWDLSPLLQLRSLSDVATNGTSGRPALKTQSKCKPVHPEAVCYLSSNKRPLRTPPSR